MFSSPSIFVEVHFFQTIVFRIFVFIRSLDYFEISNVFQIFEKSETVLGCPLWLCSGLRFGDALKNNLWYDFLVVFNWKIVVLSAHVNCST